MSDLAINQQRGIQELRQLGCTTIGLNRDGQGAIELGEILIGVVGKGELADRNSIGLANGLRIRNSQIRAGGIDRPGSDGERSPTLLGGEGELGTSPAHGDEGTGALLDLGHQPGRNGIGGCPKIVWSQIAGDNCDLENLGTNGQIDLVTHAVITTQGDHIPLGDSRRTGQQVIEIVGNEIGGADAHRFTGINGELVTGIELVGAALHQGIATLGIYKCAQFGNAGRVEIEGLAIGTIQHDLKGFKRARQVGEGRAVGVTCRGCGVEVETGDNHRPLTGEERIGLRIFSEHSKLLHAQLQGEGFRQVVGLINN